ncbi:MAG: pyridoxal 5'-phosphate synthase glutaminase subunit PdxT [Ilumatobacteraceae bacterium]
MGPLVGVLALQGGFAAHELALADLGASTRHVRAVEDLTGLDALVLPGGESTTMSMLLESSNLVNPIAEIISQGLPIFGTCAGMILLATNVQDARPDQRSFGAINIDVRRNAYGRQIDSFEADIEVVSLLDPFHAVFIRAPQVIGAADTVEVLARHEDSIVLAREKTITVASFHPELTDDTRIHEIFIKSL